jgi:hypothetical protein
MAEPSRRSKTDWAALGAYLCLVFIRADREIKLRFQRTFREGAKTIIAFIIGTMFGWLWMGWAAMTEQIATTLAFGLSAAVLVLLGETAWDSIRAPFLIHQDNITKRKSLLGENRKLRNRLRPKLEITFEHRPPFVEDHSGLQGDIFYQLRRIAVTSSVSGATVRVMIPSVMIDGLERANVYLRMMNSEQQDELHAGIPGYWDVVQANSADSGIELMRTGNRPRNLGLASRFQIIASSANPDMLSSKWVTAKVDEGGNLHFKVGDETVA